MPKFVNNIILVTQSFNSASLLANENALYASGSSLYFYNDVGVTYNLTQNTIVREYIATGSHTWFTPTGIRELLIVCVGAGGGGGSGVRQSNANRTGGGGGGGGTVVVSTIPASLLTQSSYTIVVGAGGGGGVRRTSGNTNGAVGAAGGTSSFNPFVVARGGIGGQAGDTTTPTAVIPVSGITTCTPNYGPYAREGAGSGRRIINSSQPGGDGLGNSPAEIVRGGVFLPPSRGGAPAGATGGGGTSGGGQGGGLYFNNVYVTGSAGGVGGASPTSGSNGVDDQYTSIPFLSGSFTVYGIGTGGGGGGGTATQNVLAGSGGNGGRCAGGGGGGAAFNSGSAQSGAGGGGGDGYCVIVERY